MKVVATAAKIVGVVAAGALVVASAGTLLLPGTVVAVAGISTGALAATAALASVVSGLTASKPKTHAGAISGSPTEVTLNPQAPLPYIIGRTFNAGSVVHADEYGTNNAYLSYVTVLSGCGPINAIESFKVDRQTVTFSSGAATGSYAGYMWLDTQLGTQPEASELSAPVAGFGSWGASYQMSGLAAYLWTIRFDKENTKFAGGVPEVGAVVEGVKVYDPRLDSTYPGGAGACRSDDESTWVYSDNAFLHGLTWCIGRTQNGKKAGGVSAPVESIDVPAFVEGANTFEANGWAAGGTLYLNDDKWNNLKLMLQAGAGQPIRSNALISCTYQAPRVSLATITDEDIIGEAKVLGTKPRRERINSIIPRYRSEDHFWEVVPADVVSVSTYVTEDGGTRTREADYPLVQDVDQASQLATYEIVQAREFGPISVTLKIKWIGYKPGDCVTIDSENLGMAAQKCIIKRRTLDPSTGAVTFVLESETDSKHAFALGQSGVAPPTPGLTLVDVNAVAAPDVSEWTLTGVTLTGSSGTIPALLLEGAVANPNADSVIFDYRVDGDTDWIPAAAGSPDTVRKEITGVTPGTSYEVSVRYKVRGVIGARLVLGPATAGQFSVPGTSMLAESADFTASTILSGSYAPFASIAFTDVPTSGRWQVAVALDGTGVSTSDGIDMPVLYRVVEKQGGSENILESGTLTIGGTSAAGVEVSNLQSASLRYSTAAYSGSVDIEFQMARAAGSNTASGIDGVMNAEWVS